MSVSLPRIAAAMTEWVHRWEANGWKTAHNEDVKNKGDLVYLHGLCQQVNVTWVRVCACAHVWMHAHVCVICVPGWGECGTIICT